MSSSSDAGPESAPRVRIAAGDVIAGKYRVERVLGRGGMGLVVAATHLTLDELVALKLMRAKAAANPNAAERFVREARAAARLKGAHVVKVYDVGQLDGGQPYMVMEYLDGLELRALLREHGPQTPAHAVDIAMQTLEAVTEAHLAGVVHRDLKPANLFVVEGSDGAAMVKVLDFGISKVTTGEAGSGMDMTKTDTLMGSPFYMSPEQMRSTRDVDHRTDIWAVGTILYELLAGCLPFKEDTITAQCAAVLQDEPEPPSRRAAAPLPDGLDEIVMRCLEKEPAARYASAPALARALAPYGSGSAERSLQGIERLLAGKKSDPARLFRQSGSFAGVKHPFDGRAPKGDRPSGGAGNTTVHEQADGDTTLPRTGAAAASARHAASADAAPTLLMDRDAPPSAGVPADTAASWGRQVGAAGRRRGAGLAVGLAAGAVVVLAMWLGMRLSQSAPNSTRARDTAATPPDLAHADTAAAGAAEVARRGAPATPSASASALAASSPEQATSRHAAASGSATAASPPRVASRPGKRHRVTPSSQPRRRPAAAAASTTAPPSPPRPSAVGAGDDPFGNSRF